MFYFPFHIGDYRAATAHLSNEEDLAYRRLLEVYYDTEQPISLELEKVARRLRISVAAIKTVLDDFFILTENGWINKRVDQEIEHWYSKSSSARESAKSRWDANAMRTHSERNANAMRIDANSMLPKTQDPRPKKNMQDNPAAVTVLEFLNLQAGREYRPVKANIDLIASRMKEGASVEDLKEVIERKCQQWKGDAKMAEYLRPATLFNATKFAQYIGEKESKNNWRKDVI